MIKKINLGSTLAALFLFTDPKESLGVSVLVALAFILVAASVFYSWKNFINDDKKENHLSTVLPAIALVLLLLQLVIGFPVKNKILESMEKENKESQSSGDQFEQLMAMSITSKATIAFYLELLMLGIPTAILANRYLDKQKKNKPE